MELANMPTPHLDRALAKIRRGDHRWYSATGNMRRRMEVELIKRKEPSEPTGLVVSETFIRYPKGSNRTTIEQTKEGVSIKFYS